MPDVEPGGRDEREDRCHGGDPKSVAKAGEPGGAGMVLWIGPQIVDPAVQEVEDVAADARGDRHQTPVAREVLQTEEF